jgi:spore maturation protein CgeB
MSISCNERQPLNVCYVGDGRGTSGQRAKALERLGYSVTHIDPLQWLGQNSIVRHFHLESGYTFVSPFIEKRLCREVSASKPDVIWVNQGEALGRSTLARLRSIGAPIVNYANDNPFGPELYRRFTQYRKAIDLYDLVIVVFSDVVPLALAAGAKRVIRRYISADEIAHLAYGATQMRKVHDVSFVGTWHRDGRGNLIASLLANGVPVSLWGDRWDRDPNWESIRKAWRGPGIYGEKAYAKVVGESRICLGLVNQLAGNLHTHRSTEIPAIGSLLCAKRTIEHEAMYIDGEEAVFWDTLEECARLCSDLLKDEPKRSAIAAAGRRRAIRNAYFNESVMAGVLNELGFDVKVASRCPMYEQNLACPP